jgi:tRNA pseudouridine38-40 synthase
MRIALRVEYDGTRYHGWETQRHDSTVQATLESALRAIAGHDVQTTCAVRTDARVHARGQIVHFDTLAERPLRAWTLGTNSNLPADISVSWASVMYDSFHARFSAQRRHYRFIVFSRSTRCAIRSRFATWVHRDLDAERMVEAARALIGEHDFSAFRAAGCQAKTPVRQLSKLTIRRRGEQIAFSISANAFLQHMVRNIVGSLLQVGQGKRSSEWITEVLASRDRKRAGPTAPPQGLFLLGVTYPRRYCTPPVPRDVGVW